MIGLSARIYFLIRMADTNKACIRLLKRKNKDFPPLKSSHRPMYLKALKPVPSSTMSIFILLLILLMGITGCASGLQQSNTVWMKQNNLEAAKINIQLGLTYLALNEVDRARQKLLLAQQQAPQYPAVWYAQGYLLEKTGNISDASMAYLKALQLGAKDGAVHNNYGNFLCRQKQYKAAIHQFQLAVQDSHYLHIGSVYQNAGLCALKIPNKVLAKQFFQQALAADPRLVNSREL